MSILFSTLALIPRVASQPSLNSFPDIAKHDAEAYAAVVAALTERDIVRNLAVHNVTLSRVASKKFDAITTAVRALMALLFTGFAIIVLYILVNA